MDNTNINKKDGAAADNLKTQTTQAEQPTPDTPKAEPANPTPAPTAEQQAAAALQAAKKAADKASENGTEDTPWYKDWTTYAWIAGGVAVVGLGVWAACALTSKE